MSTSTAGGRLTPVRRQYLTIKHSYPDAILLFRMGDFYECFDDDAKTLSEALEIALTARAMGKDTRIPMAGVPAVSLETNLARLIRQGHKVAICEQLSDPALSKGIVERGVVRVVTPGTVLESALLDQGANNYLAAVCAGDDRAGLAYVDVTTGEFAAAEIPLAQLPLELARLEASEILVPPGYELPAMLPGSDDDTTVTPLDAAAFNPDVARRALLDYYGVLSLEAYGLETHGAESVPLTVRAAGAIVDYLRYTWQGERPLLAPPRVRDNDAYMALDAQTRRNLELFEAGRRNSQDFSLLAALDDTRTAMGARLLRRWLGMPLLDLERLNRRLDAVQFFFDDAFRRDDATAALSNVADLERILSRIRTQTAPPRDLLALRQSLAAAERLEPILSGNNTPSGDAAAGVAAQMAWLADGLRPLPDVSGLIDAAIADEPSTQPGDGGVIREGFSPELDRIRAMASDARGFIASLEAEERERTGIRNLKVGYNQVFGYYIEVSRANLGSVPDDYQRRQTLTNGERYITPELKEYESQALDARERLEQLERALYRQVGQQVGDHAEGISRLAAAIARVDVFAGLASVAARHGYARPALDDGNAISIVGGRHPVVERVLDPYTGHGGAFVPNDAALDADDAQIMLITGPNMAGKSTYIRQVAIIVLMAQVGSFVPAASASIGLVDRIFTRVGLQDDLATGQSTFMVEMVETAAILNQATWRSLVILDEIGRGTSTYDGLSIARAVVEHLHNNPRVSCKTMFATHYHELTELAATLPGVRNYRVAVSEEDGNIAFLHRIVSGGADRSYGVHVAMLAGMPPSVVSRAQELLTELEREQAGSRPKRRGTAPAPQLALPMFDSDDNKLAEAILDLDIGNLTPLEAINKLYELQERARQG